MRYLLQVQKIFFPSRTPSMMSIAFSTLSFFRRVLAITTCELTISPGIKSSFWINFNIDWLCALALLGSLFITYPLFWTKPKKIKNKTGQLNLFVLSFFKITNLVHFFDRNDNRCKKCSFNWPRKHFWLIIMQNIYSSIVSKWINKFLCA